MTKEDLLNETMTHVAGLSFYGVRKQAIGEALDRWAKQQSIAFAEWASAHYIWVDFNKWDGDNDETYTTEELYNLFLSQTNQQ